MWPILRISDISHCTSMGIIHYFANPDGLLIFVLFRYCIFKMWTNRPVPGDNFPRHSSMKWILPVNIFKLACHIYYYCVNIKSCCRSFVSVLLPSLNYHMLYHVSGLVLAYQDEVEQIWCIINCSSSWQGMLSFLDSCCRRIKGCMWLTVASTGKSLHRVG